MSQLNLTPVKRKAPSPNFSSFYNNPDDKVFIRSNDNVIFRANRGRLVKASTFFSDMFEICRPSTSPNDNGHPIDLEFSAKVITAYLDIISISGNYRLEVDYYLLKQVYELCCFTISSKALNSVRSMLLHSAEPERANEPLDLLDFASDFNDVLLAKSTFALLRPSVVSEILSGVHTVKIGVEVDKWDERGNLLMWSKRLRPS